MNAKEAYEIFMEQTFLHEDFRRTTDELLFYDYKRDIMYAYKWLPDDTLEQCFAATDCYNRWCEFMHPEDGFAVKAFMKKIQRGEEQAKMKCRFQENGRYSWYYTELHRIQKEQKEYAVGVRRNIGLQSQNDTEMFCKTLDSQTRAYSAKAWERIVQENFQKYPSQKGCMCIFNIRELDVLANLYGYRLIDGLLVGVVHTIRKYSTSAAIVGRLSEDSFGIYLNDVTGDQDWLTGLKEMFAQVRKHFEQEVGWQHLQICAGIAYYSNFKDDKDFALLYQKAFEAWKRNNNRRWNEIEVYQKEGEAAIAMG